MRINGDLGRTSRFYETPPALFRPVLRFRKVCRASTVFACTLCLRTALSGRNGAQRREAVSDQRSLAPAHTL
jgi:hypothetical protein